MFGKIKDWFRGKKGGVGNTKTPGMDSKGVSQAVVIPMTRKFELEGLGVLGERENQPRVLDKEAFRD